jgi:hypothetical protein
MDPVAFPDIHPPAEPAPCERAHCPMPESLAAIPWFSRSEQCQYGWMASALESAGFARAAHARRVETDWPEQADEMGPAPKPAAGARERFFDLYVHPEGLVVSMNSYPHSKNRHAVNSMTLYAQVDYGILGEPPNRLETSGQSQWLAEGALIRSLSVDVANSHVGLSQALEACYQGGRPLKLSKWIPSSFYLNPELYTDAPQSSLASENDKLQKRFQKRMDRDRAQFMDLLPPELRWAIAGRGQDASPTLRAARQAGGVLNALSEAAGALGQARLAPAESQTCAAWCESIHDFAKGPDSLAPLNLGQSIAGFNFLHALAAARFDRKELPRLEAWLDAQDPQALLESSLQCDALGRNPAAVAFLQTGNGIYNSFGEENIFPLLARRGLIGHAGAIGSALFSHLERLGSDYRGMASAAARALSVFEEADQCSLACGVDWMTPLATDGEPVVDRAVALSLLTRRFPKTQTRDLPAFESLLMRLATQKFGPPVPSAPAPRL